MATLFLGTRFQSFKLDGTINNGGTVEFYATGTSTHKTTYSNSTLTVANAWPVVLNSAGCADIWYSGDADVTVKDSTGAVIDSFTSISPTAASTTTAPNMISNGSFEDIDASNLPSYWDQVLYSGGTGAQDADSIHGKYSWKFTSLGSGGGYVTTTNYFNVAYNRPFILYWDMYSTAVDVRNDVQILWYNDADALLSTTSAYSEAAANPTTWTRKYYNATPPLNAVNAKIRLIGCNSADNTPGSTFYDNVNVVEGGFLGNDNTFTGTNTFNGPSVYAGNRYISGNGSASDNNLSTNISFTQTAGANNHTFSLYATYGGALSATNYGQLKFNAVDTYPFYANVTSNISIVLSNGSTLGSSASSKLRVWVVAIYGAGGVELGIINCNTSTSIYPLQDGMYVNTTAEGGAGAADSAGVIYTTTARTNVPIRILGFIDFTTPAVAGNWPATEVTRRHYQHGMKLPGDVIQTVRTDSGAVATGTTVIPDDDTIPQITEGDEYLSLAITPVYASSRLGIRARGVFANTASTVLAAAIFRDSTADALVAIQCRAQALNAPVDASLNAATSATAATATTFRLRGGAGAAGTTTFNGVSSARKLGGVMNSFLEISEIMV